MKRRSTAITRGFPYQARVLRARPSVLAQKYDMPTHVAVAASHQGNAVDAFFACTRAR